VKGGFKDYSAVVLA
jgi:hypothetical protein